MNVWILIAAVGIAQIFVYALWLRYKRTGTFRILKNAKKGWVYFIGVKGQEDTPIKIGMTKREPTRERMPELATMSPYPLSILYKYEHPNCRAEEARVHKELGSFRVHGEWFEHHTTMGYISHLKGEH